MHRVVRAALMVVALLAVAAPSRAEPLTALDYQEIQQLYARYNFAIDSGDAEGWAGTFTDDGQFATMTGRPALVKFASDWHERGQSMKLRHWVTNIVITPSAEGATGKCYYYLLDIAAKPPQVGGGGTYDDIIVKTSNGWRFKKRQTKANPTPKPPQ